MGSPDIRVHHARTAAHGSTDIRDTRATTPPSPPWILHLSHPALHAHARLDLRFRGSEVSTFFYFSIYLQTALRTNAPQLLSIESKGSFQD